MIAELFYMDTTIWAKTPYIKGFVADLKEVIPKEYRQWDPEERVWVISYVYEEELFNICSNHFERVVKYGERRYTAIQPSPAYGTLHLLPSAPKEVIVATYRVLSKLYHPDVSNKPDAEKRMKEINVAFDKIMGGR